MTGAELLTDLRKRKTEYADKKNAEARADWPAKFFGELIEASANGGTEYRIYGSQPYIAAMNELTEADGFNVWISENGTCLVVRW